MQFLRGYCILRAVPTVASLNELSPAQRAQFLTDMARVGDALLAVTGAARVNYGIFGNFDPTLHAHIVPRYPDEPDEYRLGLPWSYPQAHIDSIGIDHQPLMQELAQALKHLNTKGGS
jgi:diadenosine tetraphosphate (Ap4A) HIT family hydrolase